MENLTDVYGSVGEAPFIPLFRKYLSASCAPVTAPLFTGYSRVKKSALIFAHMLREVTIQGRKQTVSTQISPMLKVKQKEEL